MVKTSGPPQTGLRRFKDRASRLFDRYNPHSRSDKGAGSLASKVGPSESAPIPKGIYKPGWSVALVLIMGLTCWAVASVSIWLVPVYVGIMVLLLGTPQEIGSEGSPSNSNGAPVKRPAVSARRSRSSAGIKDADKGSIIDSDLRSDAPGKSSESATSGSRSGKSRSSRGRPRKSTAKGAPAAAPQPTPASWIRIGPGKFVRADANPDSFVDTAPTLELIEEQLDPDDGPRPFLSTDSESIPELEAEPGCQGIAPSALGSLAFPEHSPNLVQDTTAEPSTPYVFHSENRIEPPLNDTVAGVSTDLDLDPDPEVQPDEEIEEVIEADYDDEALDFEDPGIEAVSESLVDDEFDDEFSETEVDPSDDFQPDRPIQAEDLRAKGADDVEQATDEEYWDEEQSPPISEADQLPSFDSRLVPSQWTTSSGSLSPRHWPRRVVRNCGAVDNFRRSHPGLPVPEPRVGSSASRNRLRDVSRHALGRSSRTRRGYRPRSPPFRFGLGFSSSNRIV